MYPWCDFTWNPITGRCSHGCTYCYMRRFKLGPLKLKSRELITNLGGSHDRSIFVGSGTDMFAADVKADWIRAVLARCREYQDNTYLFQTKNPKRYFEFLDQFPQKTIYGTTIETNRPNTCSNAPSVFDRAASLLLLGRFARRMVSTEPVMDFDLDPMARLLVMARPEFVSIGADSKGHGLPEPTWGKVQDLADILGLQGIEIRTKKNLERLKSASDEHSWRIWGKGQKY